MWKGSDGRDTLPTGGDTYAIGEKVFGAIDGVPGTVVAVADTRISVEWSDGTIGPVVYPEDTYMIRKAWPWE